MNRPELDLRKALWRTSSYSGSGDQCVEVAALTGAHAVRDSKDPNGPVLMFGPTEWRSFLNSVRNT